MTPSPPANDTGFRVEHRTLKSLLARLTWVLLGPVVLGLLTVGILSTGSGWLTVLDLAFMLVVALMLLGRWHEARSGSAMTLYGQPATPEQCRRYLRVLPAAALVLWLLANVLGNHVLAA